MDYYISSPFTSEKLKQLKYGDRVYLSGTIYTARDAAHSRLYELLKAEASLPFSLENSAIYYVGPTPEKPNEIIGSAGPTTSYRMDKYTPLMLDNGLKVMIGKGKRSNEITKSCIKNSAVYLGAVGGCGALLAKTIRSSRVIAYDELGSEAVRELKVENMPLTVIIDTKGYCLYEMRNN